MEDSKGSTRSERAKFPDDEIRDDRAREDLLRRRTRHWNFFIFASGANPRYFDWVPSEKKKYIALGSSVLFTSAIAFFTSTVTYAQIAGNGEVHFTKGSFAFGAIVAFFIFWMDRLLVSIPMAPYRFPAGVLESLWNPTADTKWFEALQRALEEKPDSVGFIRRFFSVMGALILRLAIALSFSFIVAESILLVAFSPIISTRVEQIQDQREQVAVQAIDDWSTAERAQIQSQLDNYSVNLSPAVKAAREKIAQLNLAIACANTDILALDSAIHNEALGLKSSFALCSQGATIEVSSVPGEGSLWADNRRMRDARAADLQNLSSDLANALDQESSAITSAQALRDANSVTVSSLQARLDGLNEVVESKKNDAHDQYKDRGDFLLRVQAFSDIQSDPSLLDRDANAFVANSSAATTPTSTPVPSETPVPISTPGNIPTTAATSDSTGNTSCAADISGWLCFLGRALAPPTSVPGTYAFVARTLLLGIELLPIFVKASLALRRRRPYDVLDAAFEERALIRNVMLVDEVAVEEGEKAEKRASGRKSRRSETGASFLYDYAKEREREAAKPPRRSVWEWLRPSRVTHSSEDASESVKKDA